MIFVTSSDDFGTSDSNNYTGKFFYKADYLPRMKIQGGLGLGIAFPKTVV